MIVYRALGVLQFKQMIHSAKPKGNSRSNRWVVNSDNLLVSVPQIMQEFKEGFSVLLDRSKEKTIKVFYSSHNNSNDYRQTIFIGQPISIYSEFVRIHNLYSILVWPYKIRNSELLRELYGKTLAIIAEIQTEIIDKYEFVGIERIEGNIQSLMTLEHGYNELSTPTKLYLYLLNFERDGYPEEGKRVLDLLWKFAVELRPLIAQWAYIEDYIDLNKNRINLDDWTTMVTLDARYNHETRLAITGHELIKRTKYRYYDESVDSDLYKKPEPHNYESQMEKWTIKQATVANLGSLTEEEAEKQYWFWNNKYLDMLSETNRLAHEMEHSAANMVIMLKRLGYSYSDACKKIYAEQQKFVDEMNSRRSKTNTNRGNPFRSI